jgi:hypothetical protein
MPTVLENAPRTKHLSRSRALAHDARNVLASLQVYSELLAQPGVLMEGREHYARELGMIVESSMRVIEKLAAALEAGKRSPSAVRRANAGKDSGRQGIVTNDTYQNSNFSELFADANEVRCIECR